MAEDDAPLTKAELAAIQKYIDHMHGLTQSLVRMNPATRKPVLLEDANGGDLIGSGLVVLRDGKRVLLSAGHVFGSGCWALETRVIFKREREVLLYSLGATKASPNGDLGWVTLDVEKMEKDFLSDARTKGKTLEVPFYKPSLKVRPKKDEAYGFAASNNVTLVLRLDNPDLWRDGSYEVGMRYDGRESDGRYRFKLGAKHKGHKYYEGASGAPISDPTGRIVSLVSGGDEKDDVIWGTPLADLIDEVTV